MRFEPRYYQVEADEAFRAAPADRRWMLVMATGTGKTKTACYIGRHFKNRVLWLAHQIRLVRQARDAWHGMYPRDSVGLVQGSANQPGARVVFATVQTLYSEARLDELLAHGDFDFVVVDEAHHAASKKYRELLERVCRGARVLGLTATPDREDGAKLSDTWDVVYSYTILDGLRDNALIPPFAAIDKLPDLDLKNVGGRKDFLAPELEVALLKAHVVEHTVAAVKKHHHAYRLPFRAESKYLDCSGGGIVFTATVEQARLTSEALEKAGLVSRYVHADTPEDERDRILDAFEDGLIDVLCNAVLLTEGVDIPRARWCVLARPTKSWSLYVQMVGRVLRPFGDQTEALVVDLAGATELHSIVAAAVLVDGNDCPKSFDGTHRYIKLETGEGRCQDCGDIIRCYASMGGHKWVDGKCKNCGAGQCPGLLEPGPHSWVPWENRKRRCASCGLEVQDRTAALVAKPRPKEPVQYTRLPLPGEVWASNLGGGIGIIYNVRKGDKWLPAWAQGKKLHLLSNGPVETEMSRALLDDVARRAQKVNGKYGGHRRERDYHDGMKEARKLATDHQLWRIGE